MHISRTSLTTRHKKLNLLPPLGEKVFGHHCLPAGPLFQEYHQITPRSLSHTRHSPIPSPEFLALIPQHTTDNTFVTKSLLSIPTAPLYCPLPPSPTIELAWNPRLLMIRGWAPYSRVAKKNIRPGMPPHSVPERGDSSDSRDTGLHKACTKHNSEDQPAGQLDPDSTSAHGLLTRGGCQGWEKRRRLGWMQGARDGGSEGIAAGVSSEDSRPGETAGGPMHEGCIVQWPTGVTRGGTTTHKAGRSAHHQKL